MMFWITLFAVACAVMAVGFFFVYVSAVALLKLVDCIEKWVE